MSVHALMEVEVAAGRARQVLWTAARLARRLAARPGFRGLRIYRSAISEESLLVLAEWAGWEAAGEAEADAPVALLLAQARGACRRWDSRRLESLFHLQLPQRIPSAGIAQTVRVDNQKALQSPLYLKEFGLKAMSLPGTIGVLGGRCAREPEFLFCALEFQTDTAGEDFPDSATWHEWVRHGASTLWRKERRLELRAESHAVRGEATEHRSERLGNLSVQIESSPDGATILLRLHGYLDEAAAGRLVRIRDAVVARGCRELTLDVTHLTGGTTEGLKTLVATARQVKAGGGRFTLTDSQGRYQQILRSLHLNRAVNLAEGSAPRRKAAGPRIRTSGRA